ncbi:MAG: cytochrome oxidase subunit, partial [Proteobacteria bacterium]|nr:cytochrome oxidase subunit [Pseudomonadota bacterium]
LLMFALGLMAVFATPLIYYAHELTSAGHIKLFTWLMRYGGSLATLPLSLAVLIGLLAAPRAAPDERALRAALLTSMLLFGIGGIIGFLIEGSNVTIPAHYHGSIVGVTLAFMGLTYYLLPRLGFGEPDRKWAYAQPWLYGGGQLLHVLGLVWSGGYGVQRKVAGAAQGLDTVERIAAMGLMGLGGLIAIIGGVVFLVVVGRALLRRPARA